jgi:hypothetical protein
MTGPPFRGGQGRTEDDVIETGRSLLWIALAACVLFWALVLRKWLS